MASDSSDYDEGEVTLGKTTLGERMKGYELEEYIKPTNAFLIRLDGKTFSSFTRAFKKPFDARFTSAMVQTANALMDFFGAASGFCCSDEITLVFPPIYGKMQGHVHNGRKNKIATLAAGKCSSLFLINMFGVLEASKVAAAAATAAACATASASADSSTAQASAKNDVDDSDKIKQHVLNSIPCFDARVMEIPSDALEDVSRNIFWRSNYDCRRNTVSSYGRFILGTKTCMHKNSAAQIAAMADPTLAREGYIAKVPAEALPCVSADGKSFDFNQMPTHTVYGVFMKKFLADYVNDKEEPYTRAHIRNFAMRLRTDEFAESSKFLLLPKVSLEEDSAFTKSLGLEKLPQFDPKPRVIPDKRSKPKSEAKSGSSAEEDEA